MAAQRPELESWFTAKGGSVVTRQRPTGHGSQEVAADNAADELSRRIKNFSRIL
jgi:hypothetical protein